MDDAARRQALRRIARQHHPDLGGDVETYLAAVQALEMLDAGAFRARRRGGPVEVRRPLVWRRALRRLRRRLRALRRERQDRRRRRVDARLRP